MGDDFAFEDGEVLIKKRERELWHVCLRLQDVDHDPDNPGEWGRHYRLQDETHTREAYWPEEDLVDCFMSTGEAVSGKPVNAEELRYWFNYDG
jgi:hypothetical protein